MRKTIEHILYTRISYLLYINANKTKSLAEIVIYPDSMEIYNKQNILYSMTGIMEPSKISVKKEDFKTESKNIKARHQDGVGGRTYQTKLTASTKALNKQTNHL